MKILICDSHPMMREALGHVLARIKDNVSSTEAGDYDEILSAMEEQDFDLFLIDLSIPGQDVFQTIRDIRERGAEAPIIIISSSDDPDDVQQSISSGATGYISKSSSREVLESSIRLVLAGGMYAPPDLLMKSLPRPSILRGDVSKLPGKLADLTPRQRDVLALMEKGESNKQIADGLGLSEGTVKIHVAAILKGLGVKNRTQAVILSRGGWN